MLTRGIHSASGKCLKIGKQQENIDKRKDMRFIFITVVTHPFCLFLVFISQAISLISLLVQTLFSFQNRVLYNYRKVSRNRESF
jgi:hypothetical protein